MSQQTIVFDCIGTIFSYDAFFTALSSRLGKKLLEHNLAPALFGYTWMEVSEKEYFYLSVSGRHVVYANVFRAMFMRVLHCSGVPSPSAFATEEDLDFILEAWRTGLTAREGAKECIQKLRDAGFTVYGFTTGDLKRVGGYFKNARIDMPEGTLLSCDTAGIGKPSPEAYRPILERLEKESGVKPWFAAAHMWDVGAAKRTGYVTFDGGGCAVCSRRKDADFSTGSRVHIARSGKVTLSMMCMMISLGIWMCGRVRSWRWRRRLLLRRHSHVGICRYDCSSKKKDCGRAGFAVT